MVWLVDLNLPHSIKKRDGNGNHEHTQLLALEASPLPDSSHYESIDYADLGDRERAIQAGFTNYISKPLDPEKFLNQLAALVAAVPSLRDMIQA